MLQMALVTASPLWTSYCKMEGRVNPMHEPAWTFYDTLLVAETTICSLALALSPWLRGTSLFDILLPLAILVLIPTCVLLVGRFMNRRALALRAQSPSGEALFSGSAGPREGERKAN